VNITIAGFVLERLLEPLHEDGFVAFGVQAAGGELGSKLNNF